MQRDVQVSAGAAHALGPHVVWCPKYRRPVLEGRVAARLPALWWKSYFAGTAGAVSAAMVQRFTGTRYGRPWRREKTR